LIKEAGIDLTIGRRTLVAESRNFPMDALFLRDDDIPQTVADGVADVGIVGENEMLEKGENVVIAKRLGFSKCRLSLAIPKSLEYTGVEFFQRKKNCNLLPCYSQKFLTENNISADVHVITGSVEIAPGIGLADAIFDIVSSGSTLISNRLKEVEVVLKSEALVNCQSEFIARKAGNS
jgi:ATP phosphoribosyltransferase